MSIKFPRAQIEIEKNRFSGKILTKNATIVLDDKIIRNPR